PEQEYRHGGQDHLVLGQCAQPQAAAQGGPPAQLPAAHRTPHQQGAGREEGHQHDFMVEEVHPLVVVGDAHGRQQGQRGVAAAAQVIQQLPEKEQARQREKRAGGVAGARRQPEQMDRHRKQPGRQGWVLVVAPLQAVHPGQLFEVVLGCREAGAVDLQQPDHRKEKEADEDLDVQGKRRGDDKCAGTGEIPRKAVERELQRWLRTLGLREAL
ncbi:conserved hypothetical protein, partial [Ricinus communis]